MTHLRLLYARLTRMRNVSRRCAVAFYGRNASACSVGLHRVVPGTGAMRSARLPNAAFGTEPSMGGGMPRGRWPRPRSGRGQRAGVSLSLLWYPSQTLPPLIHANAWLQAPVWLWHALCLANALRFPPLARPARAKPPSKRGALVVT